MTHGSPLTISVTRYSILGFLFGTAAGGAGVYYYVLEEYRVSNELLTEDIYVRRELFRPSCAVYTQPA